MSSVSLSSTNSRRPLKAIIWDTWDKSPEERRFLHKLDSCLLTYAALSPAKYHGALTYYLSYQFSRMTISLYAYRIFKPRPVRRFVFILCPQKDSGATLLRHGNQFNYITTAWTCGYVIGQIPSNPSIWIPMMEIVWSGLTMALAGAKNFSTLVGVRFLVGLGMSCMLAVVRTCLLSSCADFITIDIDAAEATFYPGMQYVLGSWYKPTELGKRACLFHVASAIGPMFSGFLQTGAYDGLNGVGGLAGWQWLFIIDGIITIPIGILGFIVMPNLPHNTKPSYIYTEEQLALARKRMDEIGRRPATGVFTKEKIKSFFTTWHIWTLVPSLTWAWWSDAIQMRWPPMIVAAIWNMCICIALAATPVYTHIARRWALYYMTTVSFGLSGLILAWANELTGDDKRSFVVASCNCLAYSVQAWLPILIVPQVDQPTVFVGNVTTAGIMVGLMFFALLTAYLERRDKLRKARGEDVDDGVEVDVASSGKVDIKS
ncbi:MFS general substrate transporter [Fistulina hepatica ATCC 64428]|uniref:MFS general substrate transporter n=1 Tax=Fistulina hepatica ATCC 64428 TaxID=1128425 RepID=A0A0D7AGX3_9AGAR|nr:MFS general substrate transporter [Fistulina hepatica ATCC 64428]